MQQFLCRIIPEGAVAGGRVEVIPEVGMQVVDSLIDDGHVDAFAFGGRPNIAEVYVLACCATELPCVVQMPLTAVQRVDDAELSGRALSLLSLIPVIRLQQRQERSGIARVNEFDVQVISTCRQHFSDEEDMSILESFDF
ncbi:MAG: hypothetical protein OXC58_06195 [Acidimicrobiaceae bacterium]|nr:hypothetical protein [Acidimicrobiaceae bacterium]